MKLGLTELQGCRIYGQKVLAVSWGENEDLLQERSLKETEEETDGQDLTI